MPAHGEYHEFNERSWQKGLIVTIEQMADRMLASGYDPSKNRLQAAIDMQLVNTPQAVIIQVLKISDHKLVQRKESAVQTAAKQAPIAPLHGRMMKLMSAPVRARKIHSS